MYWKILSVLALNSTHLHHFFTCSRFLKTPGGGRSIGCPKCQDGISEVLVDPGTTNPDEAWQRLSCKHSVKEVEPFDPSSPKEKGKLQQLSGK